MGMSFGAGCVSEIWSRIDKFMVSVNLPSGGVEIWHHFISKDDKRLISKEEARDRNKFTKTDSEFNQID